MNIELICLDEEKLKKITNYEETIILNEKIHFVLVIDKIPVVNYQLILQKYNGIAKGIACAEIQYGNRFFKSTNTEERLKYLSKGYTKKGLEMLLNIIFNYNIPYIHLDINPNNIASNKIAQNCNLQKFQNSYYAFHPNAKELFEYSLGENIPEKNKEKILNNFNQLLTECNQNTVPKKH